MQDACACIAPSAALTDFLVAFLNSFVSMFYLFLEVTKMVSQVMPKVMYSFLNSLPCFSVSNVFGLHP